MTRLTLRKVQRASMALQALLECEDLPGMAHGDTETYGWARQEIERVMIETVLPLEHLFDED